MSEKDKISTMIGTPDQEKQLLDYISENKHLDGALMPVLQKAQNIYGYLPIEVQELIAKELKVSLAEVYGVITFYSQFTINPKGKYKISVCIGTACYVKGAGDILEEIKKRLGIMEGDVTKDGKFSLDACRCVGACGLSPIMMVNDDVYGRLAVKDVEEILAKYN